MFYVPNNQRIALCGLAILAAIGPSVASPSNHRFAVPLGDLMCRLQKVDQTDAAGSAQTLDIDCVYQPSKGGVEEFYAGTLSTIGLDDPLKNQSMLAWVVRGPEDSDAQPGALAQSYAETSDGQALSLAGDKRTSIILIESSHQPVSKPTHLVTEMQLELEMAPG